MIKIHFLAIFLIATFALTLNADKLNEYNSIQNIPKVSVKEPEDVFNFTVNYTTSNKPCLMARFSVHFLISYSAQHNETIVKDLVSVNLTQPTNYYGKCGNTSNSLTIEFGQNWMLYLNYTLSGKEYSLTNVKLTYSIDSKIFTNATDLGEHDAVNDNLNEFNVNVGKSFKCYAKTKFNLEPNVTVYFENYQAQAFIKSDSSTVGFDTAVECVADIVGSNKLVPIVIGIVLTVLIILVLVAYVVGRRRYRPTYQQV